MKRILLGIGATIILALVAFVIIFNLAPSDEEIRVQVSAITLGNEIGDLPVVQVNFEVQFEERPMFVKEHMIELEIDTAWQIYSYNLAENGKLSRSATLYNDSDSILELLVDRKKNIDDNRRIHGYALLIPRNVETLNKQELSTVTIRFKSEGYVKSNQDSDSTSWENKFVNE